MPTYPKGPSMAPIAPMLDGDICAEGADDEEYMKPSEFGSFAGGFYDANTSNNNYSEPPRGERRRSNNTMATPAKKTTRNVASPGTSFRSGGPAKVRREPVAPPRDFDEMEFLPEPRDIRQNAKEWSRTDLSVSNDTNYSEVFHMMKSGSQQNRQVSHWATSFRESTPVKTTARRERRPSTGPGAGRPGWNANLGKKTGWKSLEELHASTSATSQRTPRYSNARSASVSRTVQQTTVSSSMSFVKESGPPSFQISDEREHYQAMPTTSHNPPPSKVAPQTTAPPSFSSFCSSSNSFSSQSYQPSSSSQTNLRSQLTNTLSRLRASLHD